MMVNLVTFSRNGKRKEFVIGSAPSVIGRKPEADIRIPLGEVSRSHCEIRISGDKVVVRDLESSNGTYVNNERVMEAALKAGDALRVGSVQFTVQIDGKPEKISPLPGSMPSSRDKKGAEQADTATRTGATRPPAAAAAAAADAPSDIDFDIDNLEELNSEDLSDLDIGEVDEISDSGIIDEVEEVEEIEGLEEISEDDLIPDDDSDKV